MLAGASFRRPRLLIVLSGVLLLAAIACLVTVPATPAGATVAKKHRAAYAEKLAYFKTQKKVMLVRNEAARQSLTQLVPNLTQFMGNGDPQALQQFIAGVARYRTTYSDLAGDDRREIVNSMNAFKARALGWFAKKSDKQKFTAAMATLRSGFDLLIESDREVVGALNAIEAQDASAANDLSMRAGASVLDGEERIGNALTALARLK
jgi:hypothetical protein